MARLKSFVLQGEALELRGYHSAVTGENSYTVSMIAKGDNLSYDDLCRLTDALREDLQSYDMLAVTYPDGKMLNSFIVQMEKDWMPEDDLPDIEDDEDETKVIINDNR